MDGEGSRASRDRLLTVAAGLAVLAALSGSAVATAVDRADRHDVTSAVTLALFIGALAVVGAIVTLTVPGNLVGWLLLAGAALLGLGIGLIELGVHGVRTRPGSIPGAGYMAAVGPGLQGVGWLLTVIVVPLVFPDGQLPGRRWRWVGGMAAAAIGLLFLGNVLSPTAQQSRLTHWHSPLGLPSRDAGVADGFSGVAVLLALLTAAAAVTGLVMRWRRGGAMVRQQLLLFAVATLLPVLILVSVVVANGAPGWVFGLVGLPLPIAILVAMVQHRLYDLRRAGNRTLLWLTMSVTVAGVYAVIVVTVTALVPAEQERWLDGVAAVAAALILLPVHGRLQRGVNRVVYGRWHEPYDVLAGLGEQLEAAADIDRLLEASVRELTVGLDLRDVSVRGVDDAAIAGTGAKASTAVPLPAYGDVVGWLCFAPPDRQLSASEQRLVRDLARQLGSAVHARLLRAELQRARERLVMAREEERRRLRRDLHDGIGPALAGLTLKTATARRSLPTGADAAAEQLHRLGEEIRQVVSDVRRVVEGLRPPALDELGLPAACVQAVDRLTADAGVASDVRTNGYLETLPAAVEVAAYRIVVEAVTNCVRHAKAKCCAVTLGVENNELVVKVVDDGDGLAVGRATGHGLAIMRERAEELGGTLAVTPGAGGRGVCVDAHLPVAAPATFRAPAEARRT